MSKIVGVFLFLLCLSQFAFCQASPTATRSPIFLLFKHRDMPDLGGNLEYSVSASESFISGYYGPNGTASFSNISGNLAYLTHSSSHPLSVIYSGGYLGSTTGQASSVFQNFAISQVVVTKSWDYVASDSVSYLPETPTTGLSGIPGLGDTGTTTVTASDPGQGILTGQASRVANTAQGSIQHRFTGSTSVQASGSYLMQRFLGDSSGVNIDNNQITAFLGPTHRIDARNSINGNVTYSRFTYTGSAVEFNTQGINAGYSRQLTRKLTLSVSGGPQRTTSSTAPALVGPAQTAVPGVGPGESAASVATSSGSSLSMAANASLTYFGRGADGTLSYVRGVNNGSGAVEGGLSDSLRLDVRRPIGHSWNVSGQLAYARTTSLSNIAILPFATETVISGVQASRSINRKLFAYVSYTAQRQSVSGTPQVNNVFSGVSNVVGVGITYSPGPLHRRDR